MTGDQALKFLQQINGLLELANPLVGTLVTVGTEIANDLRSQGASVGDFQTEIARFDAAIAKGLAANADWRTRHGVPPAGTEIQATDQNQQPPGSGGAQPQGGDPLTPATGGFGDR